MKKTLVVCALAAAIVMPASFAATAEASSHGEPVKDEVLKTMLPGVQVFARVARRWPVAHAENSGVTFVDATGGITEVKDKEALKRYVLAHFPPAVTADDAKQAARAWLVLLQPLVDDGFFRFAVDEASLEVSPTEGAPAKVRGVSKVVSGGRGQITATLTYGAEGRLAAIASEEKLEAGMRPICQSTKLLDPDPVVRGMARQDLLVMGVAARAYLDEMRPKLTPELRNAVDELWQEILRREAEFGEGRAPTVP